MCPGTLAASNPPTLIRCTGIAQEGETEEALNEEVKSTLVSFREEEHRRNRARMVEIREFRQSVQRRVDEYIAREFPDSD